MSSDPPKKTAVLAAAEFMKYTVGLGTGALVFSAGLVGDKVALSTLAANFLIGSWVLLTFSIVCGVIAYSRIPVQLAEQSHDIEDRYFTFPGRAHQAFFLFGIISLGIALIVIARLPREDSVHSAKEAIELAASKLPEGKEVAKVDKVELISGTTDSKLRGAVWHVQLHLKPKAMHCTSANKKTSATELEESDLYIDAKSSKILEFRNSTL